MLFKAKRIWQTIKHKKAEILQVFRVLPTRSKGKSANLNRGSDTVRLRHKRRLITERDKTKLKSVIISAVC